MDWLAAIDDAMCERWPGGCLLCQGWPLDHLVIRDIVPYGVAVSLCARCWARDPTYQQVDVHLLARYAPGRFPTIYRPGVGHMTVDTCGK